MAALRHLIPAFLGGEIDPLMAGRVDTDNYAYGLALCENFAAINEGPLVKRPGFEYICDAAPTASWLSAFRFSITQEYVIEWSQLKARFYTNGGRIETSPGVPYETVTPYAAADAPRLSLQQSYDRLYIDHASYAPAALTRATAITFTHANSVLNNGPFLDQNSDEAVTVSASAASGAAITVTASSAIFAAGHVGALFRLEAKDFSTIKVWEPGMAGVVIGDIVRSDGKAYQAATAGNTGSSVPIHASGSEWDGQGRNDVINAKGPFGIKWSYLHERYGTVKITGFTSPTQVTADVIKRLPDQVITLATHRWAHCAFSAAEGWPSLVCHGFGRQVHFKNYDIYGSVVGDFGGGTVNFQSTTNSGTLAADLSFRRTIATEDPPLWVAVDRKLLVGTAGKELAVGAINAALAVSGDNIAADPQSFYGSEPIWPVQVGTETISVERGARRLRSAGYDFARDRYTAVDLTAAARHITKGGLIQLAYQRVPFGLFASVRGDGQLVCHADTRAEMKGFTRTVLANASGYGAQAISAVSVVGEDGKSDELWLLVSRASPSGIKREIWRQTAWRESGDAADQAFFVDCGTQAAATGGQTHFSGLNHLAGQPVAVLAGGGVIPGMSVGGDGTLDLPPANVPSGPYTLIVGLSYTAVAVTLRPEAKLRLGSIQGLTQRVRKAMLRLLDSVGLKVGTPTGHLEQIIERPANAAMDAPIPLFTGDAFGRVDASYDRDGAVRFVSDAPLPAIITAAMLSLEVDEQDV